MLGNAQYIKANLSSLAFCMSRKFTWNQVNSCLGRILRLRSLLEIPDVYHIPKEAEHEVSRVPQVYQFFLSEKTKHSAHRHAKHGQHAKVTDFIRGNVELHSKCQSSYKVSVKTIFNQNNVILLTCGTDVGHVNIICRFCHLWRCCPGRL